MPAATLRIMPAHISHQLMMRAGMIKKVAAGIYTYLPLGLASLQKMEAIVREEMNARRRDRAVDAGDPAGRAVGWSPAAGSATARSCCASRTATSATSSSAPRTRRSSPTPCADDVKSYRQLPVNLYQIQTKFRDEIRPRFGLMRGREFLMKDAYSFHATPRALDETYETMRVAYCADLRGLRARLHRRSRPTPAPSAARPRTSSWWSPTGESAVVRCPNCGYARQRREGDVEVLRRDRRRRRGARQEIAGGATRRASTPSRTSAVPRKPTSRLVKTLIYETEKGWWRRSSAATARSTRSSSRTTSTSEHPGAVPRRSCGRRPARRSASPVRSARRTRACSPTSSLRRHQLGRRRQQGGHAPSPTSTGAATSGAGRTAISRPSSRGDPCPRCDGTLQILAASRSGTSSSSAPSTPRRWAARTPTRRASASR